MTGVQTCALPICGVVLDSNNLQNKLGKRWWQKEDYLDIEVSAEVSNQFKKAFLKIGVSGNWENGFGEEDLKLGKNLP